MSAGRVARRGATQGSLANIVAFDGRHPSIRGPARTLLLMMARFAKPDASGRHIYRRGWPLLVYLLGLTDDPSLRFDDLSAAQRKVVSRAMAPLLVAGIVKLAAGAANGRNAEYQIEIPGR